MLKLTKVSYRYKSRKDFTLKNINLHIKAGEMLLIAGRTGCGKSTLLKLMNGLLTKNSKGEFLGEVTIESKNMKELLIAEIGLKIGTVYQAPEDQLFAMSVEDEIAFILENQNLETAYIKEQVAWALEKVGLQGLGKSSIHSLSGGQKQRLALASVIISKPKILILDEPMSQMNPQGVVAFLELLKMLNQDLNMTIIVVEHRVHELNNYFSRIIFLETGSILYDGLLSTLWENNAEKNFLGLREPENIKLSRALKLGKLCIDTRELLESIKTRYPQAIGPNKKFNLPQVPKTSSIEELVNVQNLYYKYSEAERETLQGVNFSLNLGEAVALMGSNGAGKSTILNLLAGLITNYHGNIKLLGGSVEQHGFKLGILRQEPDLMLLADTVREEIFWKNKSLTVDRFREISKKLGLDNLLADFPLALSKGQRLRVVLASILARQPQVLLLDEPTTGQDQESLQEIQVIIAEFKKNGGILFCTHDVELAAQVADRIILLNEGRVVKQGLTKEILSSKEDMQLCGLSIPPMVEVAKGLQMPPCVTIKEVVDYVC